jgi:hypothetical protein
VALLIGFCETGSAISVKPKNNAGINGADRRADQIIRPESADERIADWTETLAIFTGVLVFVSAIQIGFLIRADKTARQSAEAATVAAKLSQQQFSVAQEAHELQFRPYLSLQDIVCGEKGVVTIRVVNKGKTPANNVTARFYYSLPIGKDGEMEDSGTAIPENVQITPEIPASFSFVVVELDMIYYDGEATVVVDIGYNDWFTINIRNAKLAFRIKEGGQIVEIDYKTN